MVNWTTSNGYSPWTYTPNLSWGNLTTSTSKCESDNTRVSHEDYVEAQRKKRDESLKIFNDNKKIHKEMKAQLKEAERLSKQLEKGKQKDGSAIVEMDLKEYKKLPWWKKTLRAASNMGQGIINLATKFIGIEDGKWNPGKCLLNVGIAAGALALCSIPYVGPVIGATLLASGVASGGYAVYKGIEKANNAKTLQELDGAYQEIGAGAFIGVSSALGIRGLGKGFRLSGSHGASVAKTRTSWIGKAWQKTSQFARDITINAYKSTKMSVGEQATTFSTEKANATWKHCKGIQAFGKVYKSNLKTMLPSLGKKRFEETKQRTVDNIQRRIDEIGSNPTDKLLQRELKSLNKQLAELNRCTSKNQWINNKNSSEAHKELKKLQEAAEKLQARGKVTINGKKLNSSKPEDVKALNELIKSTKNIAKSMESLSNLRLKTMRWMAIRPKKHQAELEAYVGHSRTSAGYLWDINKGTYSWKTPFKLGWDVMSLPFQPWNYLSSTAAGTAYKIEQAFLPTYEKNIFVDLFGMFGADLGVSKTLTAEETKEAIAQCQATKKALEEEEKKFSNNFDQLS